MNNTNIFDKDLNPLLDIVESEDLEPLVGYLKNKLSESLTASDAYKKYSPDHHQYADLIAKEIRDFGGNSFANLFRGEGPEYREIVEDVAKKLKVNFNNGNDIEALENKIFEKILETALEKMSDEEKAALGEELGMKHGAAGKGGFTTSAFIYLFKAGGFKSYQITLIIANYIAKLILGHGLRLGTNAAIARTASILTGPIGWAITGIWTAVDLAGPSYKTTIPCVIHVAMLRKKYNSLQCTNDECGAVLTDTTTKFCPECGTKVA